MNTSENIHNYFHSNQSSRSLPINPIMDHQLHYLHTQQRYTNLLFICNHFLGKERRLLDFQPFLFQNTAINKKPWYRNISCHKSKDAFRRETIRKVFVFLISYYPLVKTVYRREIIIVAHLIECNLYISATTKKSYCDINDLGRRCLVILRFLAQVIMLWSKSNVGTEDGGYASLSAVAA